MGRPSSRVSRVVVAGPLAPFVAVYASRLEGRGYTPLTTVNALRVMALASRWLEGSGLTAADLNGERVDQFVEARRAAGYTLSCSARSLVVLREMLAEMGVLPVEPEAPAGSAIDVLLASRPAAGARRSSRRRDRGPRQPPAPGCRYRRDADSHNSRGG